MAQQTTFTHVLFDHWNDSILYFVYAKIDFFFLFIYEQHFVEWL